MTQAYALVLNEGEDKAFSSWWRSLAQEDKDEIQGTVIEPRGFVSPHDWFASLPRSEKSAIAYTVDWDNADCDADHCEVCPMKGGCEYVKASI